MRAEYDEMCADLTRCVNEHDIEWYSKGLSKSEAVVQYIAQLRAELAEAKANYEKVWDAAVKWRYFETAKPMGLW